MRTAVGQPAKTQAATDDAHDSSAPSRALRSAHCVLLAGGGSGGHISPGIAIAEQLREIEPDMRCAFACSARAVDGHMLSDAGERFIALDAQPFRRSLHGAIRFIRGWLKAAAQAKRLLRDERVDHVVLLGGFVAAPVASAAAKLRISTTLINLDVPPGRANRTNARWADAIWTALPLPNDSAELVRELPARFAQTLVPMPVRKRAIANDNPQACRAALGLDPALPTLLVTGASQGARSLNDLMVAIAQRHRDWLDGWQVLHLGGHGESESLIDTYRNANVRATVLEFCDAMGAAWGAADLALSRGGANSIAEIVMNAVPSVILPYPWHADRHQWKNAQPLVEIGGALIVEDRIDAATTLEIAGDAFRHVLQSSARRDAMRSAIRSRRPAASTCPVGSMLLQRIHQTAS